MGRQLYRVVPNVEIPERAGYDARSETYFEDGSRLIPATVFMLWPNGFPCIEVNLYLSFLADSLRTDSTGGSLKEVAAMLSHIVRFCWEHEGVRRNFWNLDNGCYEKFLGKLLAEKHRYKKGAKSRANNRVIEISEATIAFLKWLQKNVLIGRRLIGLRGEGFAVELIEQKEKSRFGNTVIKEVFPFKIVRSTRDPKPPIAMQSIQTLWLVLEQKSDIDQVHPVYRRRFRSKKDLEAVLNFLRRRRECMFHIMQASGSRPYELELCSFTDNVEVSISQKLVIPTVKRERGAERGIPLKMSTAVKIDLYIECRNEYLTFLKGQGFEPNPGDALFINEVGSPITRAALTKEFERLCKMAGLSGRQCLSMFRHRFITLMVAIELKQVLDNNPSFPVNSEVYADYRTILTRVAALTGHADPSSLMSYIHLGWKELGVFDGIDAIRDLAMLLEEVRALRSIYAAEDGAARKAMTADELERKINWFDTVMRSLTEGVEEIITRRQSGQEARTVRL